MVLIGIDLGTTNSLVAVWKDAEVLLIPNNRGDYLTPSLVFLDSEGNAWVGEAAREQGAALPQQLAASFKRFMGTHKKITVGKKSYRPQELSAVLLRQLKQDAEDFLGEKVEEAIISVPAYFNDEQRYATREAGMLAGLKVERLVNEPSAAALASRGLCDTEETFLVVDFGGGTLDISVVECFEQIMEIIAVAGDTQLGGDDFDKRIAEYFCIQHKMKFEQLPIEEQKLLLRKAESCKRNLSEQDVGRMDWEYQGQQLSLILDPELLVKILAPLLKRMENVIWKALRDSGIGLMKLDKVILVGGTCNMPIIGQYIHHFLKMEPIRSEKPEEMVARGCGWCVGIKERREEIRDVILTDICPFTLGVGVTDPENPKDYLMSPIIERNSVLPISREETYCPLTEQQTSIKLRIYQGESMHCSENLFLGELSLAIPRHTGFRSFLVRFTYDINGLLEIEASNQAGQKVNKWIVNSNLRTNQKEYSEMVNRLNQLKMQSQKNEYQQLLISRAEKLYQESISKERVLLQEYRNWLLTSIKNGDPIRIREAQKALEELVSCLEEKYSLT